MKREQIEKKIDYPTVLNRQFDRLFKAMSLNEDLSKPIEALDVALSPYRDEDYNKEIENLFANKTQLNDVMKRISQNTGIPIQKFGDNENIQVAYVMSKQKAIILMKLAFRNGLLPDKEENWDERDYD